MTAQMGDILHYEGVERLLFTNPLDDWFSQGHPVPERIIKGRMGCTANWRGYVAVWKIEDSQLFLLDVRDYMGQPSDLISEIFPDTLPPIRATWFTGDLMIPDGNLINYVHMGYSSTYERSIWIHIDAGAVTSTQVFTNSRESLIDMLRDPFIKPLPTEGTDS